MMEDGDMRRVVTRLASTASDADVRRSMSIEEVILTALANRDTEIMLYKREAADAKKEAADAKKVIAKQTEQLASAIRALKATGTDGRVIVSALGITEDEYNRLTTK